MKTTMQTNRKIKDFIRKVYDCIVEELASCSSNDRVAYATYNTADGSVEIEMHRNGEHSVTVLHDRDNEKISSNLEKMIEDNLPDWDEVQEQTMREDRDEENFREYVRNIH